MRKPLSPWLIVALIAVPLLLLAAPFATLWWIAGRALERVEVEKIAILAQDKRPRPVPPLFADPLPDDGAVYYDEAVNVLKEARPLAAWPSDLAFRAPPVAFPSRETLAKLWSQTRPVSESLQKLLRCSRITGKSRFDTDTASLLLPCLLMNAEFARLEQRDADALRLLILVLGTNQACPNYQGEILTAHAANGWAAVLDGHALTAAEAAGFGALLERLEAAREPLIDRVRRESAYRRLDALAFTQPDEFGNRPGSNPEIGWKQMWSDRMLAYEALKATESDERELTRICRLPIHEQHAAALALEESIPEMRVRIQARSANWKLAVYSGEFESESWDLLMLRMCRIATAIAAFDIDQGRKPATLQELVPKYLARLDPCPVTGHPVEYRDGVLLSPEYEAGRRLTWTVRRR